MVQAAAANGDNLHLCLSKEIAQHGAAFLRHGQQRAEAPLIELADDAPDAVAGSPNEGSAGEIQNTDAPIVLSRYILLPLLIHECDSNSYSTLLFAVRLHDAKRKTLRRRLRRE